MMSTPERLVLATEVTAALPTRSSLVISLALHGVVLSAALGLFVASEPAQIATMIEAEVVGEGSSAFGGSEPVAADRQLDQATFADPLQEAIPVAEDPPPLPADKAAWSAATTPTIAPSPEDPAVAPPEDAAPAAVVPQGLARPEAVAGSAAEAAAEPVIAEQPSFEIDRPATSVWQPVTIPEAPRLDPAPAPAPAQAEPREKSPPPPAPKIAEPAPKAPRSTPATQPSSAQRPLPPASPAAAAAPAPQQAIAPPGAAGAQASRPVGPASGDSAGAQLLRRVEPRYPAAARERGIQGRVILSVLVGADGKPAQVEVQDSSNSADLDRAARDAVLQWLFTPARRFGTAVPERILIPVSFALRGG